MQNLVSNFGGDLVLPLVLFFEKTYKVKD